MKKIRECLCTLSFTTNSSVSRNGLRSSICFSLGKFDVSTTMWVNSVIVYSILKIENYVMILHIPSLDLFSDCYCDQASVLDGILITKIVESLRPLVNSMILR